MFIIPVQDRIDWRRPPVVTIALILLNCLAFFWSTHRDAYHYQQIESLPVDVIVEREWALYQKHQFDADPTSWHLLNDLSGHEREQQMRTALFDWEYDAWLANYWNASPPDSTWRAQRDALATERDALSWVRWGFIPSKPDITAALASMFLHADIWHLFGNMLFLALFGAAMERHWGTRYLTLIYLAGGMLSNLACWLINMDSGTPGIGASGAISALMGAYAASYGVRRIEFFYSVGLFFGSFTAPAMIVFPIWLGWELLQNVFTDNNVNYIAHAGGLVGGVLVTLLALSVRGDRTQPVAPTGNTSSPGNPVEGNQVPASLIRLTEQLAFDRACAECQQQLKRNPNNPVLWTFYLETAARCNAQRRDQAMGEALALLNNATPADALVSRLLPLFSRLGGDTQTLAPPFRLLEAELYFRQKNHALAYQHAQRLSRQWQHPRLDKLITRLEIS